MQNSQIAVRYAKALFSLASEQGRLSTIRNDVEILYDACLLSDFNLILEHPTLQASDKMIFFEKIFDKKLTKTSFFLIKILLKNKREIFLKDISRNFLDMYRKHTGIKKAILITPGEINPNLRSRIKYWVKNNFNTQIDLEEQQDENLIGGFILRVEDQQIDGSVKNQLRKIKRNLSEMSIF